MQPYIPCGCTATITDGDERAKDWKYVFGNLTFPIRMPLYSTLAAFPGKHFLNGDVAALDRHQRRRLIETVSLKFGIPPEEVADNLNSGFFPILDEHITIGFCKLHSRLLLS